MQTPGDASDRMAQWDDIGASGAGSDDGDDGVNADINLAYDDEARLDSLCDLLESLRSEQGPPADDVRTARAAAGRRSGSRDSAAASGPLTQRRPASGRPSMRSTERLPFVCA